MEAHWGVLFLLVIAFWGNVLLALPTTLLEDAQAAEARIDSNKVKRAHSTEQLQSAPNVDSQYYGSLSAAKRASSFKNEHTDTDPETLGWEQEKSLFDNERQADILEKPLFAPNDNPFEDKTLAEYQKGFHYGMNKAKLDEQMENAILKSEMYGDQAAINQYRYYGGSDDRRRKRSNLKRNNIRFSHRYKREVELSPEDILTLLSLWEEDRLRQPKNAYRTSWSKFNTDSDMNEDTDEMDIDPNDDSWLNSPVYPASRNPMQLSQFSGRTSPYNDGYFDMKSYEPHKQMHAKQQWEDYSDRKHKRFMVSKKRNDPTRELRYLNGPNQNRDDIYSLTQLLGASPREPKYYHRMVL